MLMNGVRKEVPSAHSREGSTARGASAQPTGATGWHRPRQGQQPPAELGPRLRAGLDKRSGVPDHQRSGSPVAVRAAVRTRTLWSKEVGHCARLLISIWDTYWSSTPDAGVLKMAHGSAETTGDNMSRFFDAAFVIGVALFVGWVALGIYANVVDPAVCWTSC